MNTIDDGYGDWKRDQMQDEKAMRIYFDFKYKQLHAEIAQATAERDAADYRRSGLVAQLHKLVNEQAWKELEP